ncbi:short-chain dehydrogenase [Achromobacter spanius]|uniref:Short-chain dehydrogenase n=1 Tax=Achromobacter spanius TaxID=217203 RepID=A0A2S5GL26_9BURK|nr:MULTISPECIES: SDR family NAD(P)-dependent oxidoreductase [Achromobacter]AYD65139.1 SDR family NAD(P)-dependent oxidoreductase [Achromobacter sp. B7]MDX3984829.1 SDR family NAD(P)-dependent oxidoreductase [Achromobacter sp.]PPA73616.1 short-chain dehydrogenase [Achromobacter spanius]QYJ19276.1 SDR family NAD(P)-dependent oxidoreductase [Achromobacter sp. ES-001]HCQ48434.1 KR domain-containing protein [Achromobacter sp.]
MQMTGNTIFITGGTSGIGRALAEQFHSLGNKVIVAGRRQALLDEVAAANPGIDGVALDISDAADIERVAAQLIRDYPTLNVVINNAGIMPFDDPSGRIDDAVSRQILDTNLLGPIRLTSALVEHLKAQPRATIIHNTSVLAYVPIATNAVYSASKAALHSYALSQRFMLRDTSVTVQEIAPPWVDTDLIKKSGDPRAMPLDAFIAETMTGLATDAPEVFVEAIRALRDNPGLGEHALVHGFNAEIAANPIPV